MDHLACTAQGDYPVRTGKSPRDFSGRILSGTIFSGRVFLGVFFCDVFFWESFFWKGFSVWEDFFFCFCFLFFSRRVFFGCEGFLGVFLLEWFYVFSGKGFPGVICFLGGLFSNILEIPI